MTMIFCDGYDRQDVATKYESVVVNAAFGYSTDTRFGTGYSYGTIGSVGSNVLFKKNFAAASKVIVGVAAKLSLNDGDSLRIYGDSGATSHLNLRVMTTGAIALFRGSTQIATTAPILVPNNTWNYYEIAATIADAGGTAVVRFNGVEVINFTGDTKNGGTNNTIDAVGLVNASTLTGQLFDDLVIMNDLGTVNNTFLGDVQVIPIKPNGAGSVDDLTPVGTANNWENVDEMPASATDYNYSATAGHQDLYALEDVLAGTSAVHAVQVCSFARKTSTATRSVKNLLRTGGTTTAGTARALGTGQAELLEMFDKNPTTAAAWAVGDIAALEAGVEVV